MPEDELRLRAWGELFSQLAPLVVVLGVLGVLIIVGLVIAWRRYRRRLAALDEDLAQRLAQPPLEDLWVVAATRADPPPSPPPGERLKPTPPPQTPPCEPDDELDAGFEDDDEENEDPDANASWRQSLPEWPQFDDEDEDDDEPEGPRDDQPPPDQPPPDDDEPDDAGPQDWPRPPRR